MELRRKRKYETAEETEHRKKREKEERLEQLVLFPTLVTRESRRYSTCAPAPETSIIWTLLPDLTILIFSFLVPVAWLRIRRVCKAFKRIIEGAKMLWKPHWRILCSFTHYRYADSTCRYSRLSKLLAFAMYNFETTAPHLIGIAKAVAIEKRLSVQESRISTIQSHTDALGDSFNGSFSARDFDERDMRVYGTMGLYLRALCFALFGSEDVFVIEKLELPISFPAAPPARTMVAIYWRLIATIFSHNDSRAPLRGTPKEAVSAFIRMEGSKNAKRFLRLDGILPLHEL